MGWIRRLGREPLVHFLLIGAALFLVFGLTQAPGGKAPNRIVVDAGQVEQLAAQFSRTWLRPPTQEELVGLVREHVRDEVYYREALAMGLDQNDPLIRRRMRQKLEFILEDLSNEQAGDDALNAFLRQHPDRYRVEPEISFRQVYLSPERRKDLPAEAGGILERLRKGAPPESVGDPTVQQAEFRLATTSEIARLFGQPFAEELAKVAPGAWTGPLASGLGAHLVLVSERREGRMPALAEIRGEVEREYLAQRRQALKDAAYRKLLEGYQVVIEPARAPGAAAAEKAAPGTGNAGAAR